MLQGKQNCPYYIKGKLSIKLEGNPFRNQGCIQVTQPNLQISPKSTSKQSFPFGFFFKKMDSSNILINANFRTTLTIKFLITFEINFTDQALSSCTQLMKIPQANF